MNVSLLEKKIIEKVSEYKKRMTKDKFEDWCYNLYKQTVLLNKKFEDMTLKSNEYKQEVADFIKEKFYPRILLTEKVLLNLDKIPNSVDVDILTYKINAKTYLEMYEEERRIWKLTSFAMIQ